MGDYKLDLDHALQLADVADNITMRVYRSSDMSVKNKSDNSPVTQGDLEVEKELSQIVVEQFNENYVGEEGTRTGTGDRIWTVDPIDGTRNFVRGMPIWGTLIALAENGATSAAAVSAPALGRHERPPAAARYVGFDRQRPRERPPAAPARHPPPGVQRHRDGRVEHGHRGRERSAHRGGAHLLGRRDGRLLQQRHRLDRPRGAADAGRPPSAPGAEPVGIAVERDSDLRRAERVARALHQRLKPSFL